MREGRARVPPEPAARHRSQVTSGTKRTRSRPLRSRPFGRALDDEQALVAGLDRHDQPARRSPSCSSSAVRDVVAGRGGDVDRVERRRLRQPAGAVADDHGDVVDRRPRARLRCGLLGQRGVALDAPDVRAEAAPASRRGSPSRCRRRGSARGRAAASSSHMRATTSGCEIVWPAPIGSGTLSHASAASASGTNRSRGTSRIASSTRSSRDVRAQLVDQPIAAAERLTPSRRRPRAPRRARARSHPARPRRRARRWSRR